MAYKKKKDHNAYMRKWRKTHPLNEAHRRRGISRAFAGVYKRRGRLAKHPCTVCGSRDSQMHHPDHELPLLVVWLCRPCHLAWHAHWRDLVMKAFAEWLEIARMVKAAMREAAE